MVEQRPGWEIAKSLPPGTIVQGGHKQQGLGMLLDCPIPFAGTRRLVHWLRSPYADAPDGIIDDADSVAVGALAAISGHPRWIVQGQIGFPDRRSERANLLSADGGKLAGLRGWDIPHDRHLVLSDVATGNAEIAPSEYPAHWATSWRLEIGSERDAAMIRIDWTFEHGEEARD